MARPKQDGLLYFPLDTDFFYADRRIKALRSRYGSDGLIFYIYLLTEIYRNGYYIRWDEDSIDNAMADLGLTEGLIEQVMTFLVSRSLLCKRILADSDTIITSPGIQKRYQEAVKGLRRDVCVDGRIWLLKDEQTAPFIKFTVKKNKSCKNPDKSGGNESKSCKNPINEIKRNEINKDIVATPAEPATATFTDGSFEIRCVDTLIDSCLKTFPNSKVPRTLLEKQKWAIEIDRMKRLEGRGEDEILQALNYAIADSFWQTNIRSAKKFREKFETLIVQSKMKHGKENKFNQFQQNHYDFDRLEKNLLSN